MKQRHYIAMAVGLVSAAAFAQTKPAGPVTLSNDKPVEVSSNTLEVQQDKHQAIFTGNVIATQGLINMRSDQMIVHYVNDSSSDAKDGKVAPSVPKPKPAKKAAGAGDATTNGISSIDASGHVIFTNPTDTAKGDTAHYDVAAQTLDLYGKVILTRDKNILNGTHMHYDLATARSVLTAGANSVSDTGVQTTTNNGRVHGLFVPASKPKPATGAAQ